MLNEEQQAGLADQMGERLGELLCGDQGGAVDTSRHAVELAALCVQESAADHSEIVTEIPAPDPEPQILTIDFSAWPEALEAIKAVAHDEDRTPEEQGRYWLRLQVARREIARAT